ncbi:MucR family transcriptional regulator, partial [Mesorhizobium sp.]|uniref:MucR family transcriptional regulator n=1 Tax=Mesorhizobium sp. TaxID=1871066 RepID=UPI000FE79FDF
MSLESGNNLIELTADIVSAYVQKNPVPASGLPDLIASVNSALSNIGNATPPEAPSLKPAVNPKKSIYPDYIISLEDGQKYKSLKRHLAVRHGLTPDEYRTKWGLAKDYPMV